MIAVYNESNIIIAGNPAKIIKHNIDWCRDNSTNIIKKQKKMLENKTGNLIERE